jgi:hypothetical protein
LQAFTEGRIAEHIMVPMCTTTPIIIIDHRHRRLLRARRVAMLPWHQARI